VPQTNNGPQFGTPVTMFEVPVTTDAFIIDVVVLKSTYILVSSGTNMNGAALTAYTLSGTTLSAINVAVLPTYFPFLSFPFLSRSLPLRSILLT
jgi:hypothetical protein